MWWYQVAYNDKQHCTCRGRKSVFPHASPAIFNALLRLIAVLAGYVPPHSRRGDGTSSAASFSLSHDASGPGKLGSLRGRALPPGAAPPDTKSASKNSKRRSKKKGGGAVTGSTNAEEEGGDGGPEVADDAVAGQQIGTVSKYMACIC